MALFSFGTAPKHEEEFWTWFQKHEDELYNFEKDTENVFDRLSTALGKIDKNLTFEFGPVREDGKREFVISAGGIKASFPKVEALYSSAPKLDRWVIVKFRPRRAVLHDLQYEGKNVKAGEVKYLLFKDTDANKVGILLLLPGYAEAEKEPFGQIGFLFLDEALGEYDMETRVGAVQFTSLDSKYAKDSRPLSELASHFDEYLAKKD